MTPPIFVVTGTPASGKSTFCRELLSRFPFGIHIEGDVLREFVVSGIAHPLEWTDETTRQFALVDETSADIAIRYQRAGFAAALDHCRRIAELDSLIQRRLRGLPVYRAVLHAELPENHSRNKSRTEKDFNHEVLIPTIDALNPIFLFEARAAPHWVLVETDGESVQDSVDRFLEKVQLPRAPGDHTRTGR